MKRYMIFFMFLMMSVSALVLGISCSNSTPNSAFIAPIKTVSGSNPTWTYTPTFTFTPSPTATPAFPVLGFNGPYALAIDPTGKEYVGDTGNNIIRQYNNGVLNTSWPNGLVKSNGLTFTSPEAIATDPQANLYVVGTGAAVTKFDSFGNQVASYNTSLSGAKGVACAGTTLFVSDTGHNQIVEYSLPTGAATTILSGLGYQPLGLAAISSGVTLFVAGNDQNIHVYAYVTSTWGAGSPAVISMGATSSSSAVALDSINDLFVSDTGNKQIEEFAVNNYLNGPVSYFGQGVLNSPQGIAIDASNNIYVVDSSNNTFYQFAP